MRPWILGALVAASLTACACSPRESPSGAPAEALDGASSPTGPVTFVNQVWEVVESDQVASGSVRVFLSDGTLVMASPNTTPAFGTWNYEDAHLTITEEGLNYDVDIIELTHDAFRVRIHSPGEPVEIRFAPAERPMFHQGVRQPTGMR